MQNNKIKEVQLHYSNPNSTEELFVRNSNSAHDILLTIFDKNQLAVREEFVVLYLNRANKVIGSYSEFKGGITGVVVDPRLIFSVALKCLAVTIILAHNHPSGHLKPSQEDLDLTKKIKHGGNILDIQVLDHIILSPCGKYFSFADEGIL